MLKYSIIAVLFISLINIVKSQNPAGNIYFNFINNYDTVRFFALTDSGKKCTGQQYKLFDEKGIFSILCYKMNYDNDFSYHPEYKKDSIYIINSLTKTDTTFIKYPYLESEKIPFNNCKNSIHTGFGNGIYRLQILKRISENYSDTMTIDFVDCDQFPYYNVNIYFISGEFKIRMNPLAPQGGKVDSIDWEKYKKSNNKNQK